MDAVVELHDVAGAGSAGHGAVGDVAGVVAAVDGAGQVVGRPDYLYLNDFVIT